MILSDRELGVAAVLVFAVLSQAVFAAYYTLDERKQRKKRRMINRARMYEMRRDREAVRLERYEREAAAWRTAREGELFGEPEKPLRKACGLFSDEAAQRCVR